MRGITKRAKQRRIRATRARFLQTIRENKRILRELESLETKILNTKITKIEGMVKNEHNK